MSPVSKFGVIFLATTGCLLFIFLFQRSVAKSIVEKHKHDATSETRKNSHQGWYVVPSTRIVFEEPECHKDTVLCEYHGVVGWILVTGWLGLDIQVVYHIGDSDHHIAGIFTALPQLTIAGLSAKTCLLVHHPDGHHSPVADAKRKEPEVIFPRKECQRASTRAHCTEMPQELQQLAGSSEGPLACRSSVKGTVVRCDGPSRLEEWR